MRFLANLARIRRVEFLVVELTIFLMPVLVTVGSLGELGTWVCAEAFALFFVLYALGDGINCLADRDLDAKYKTHLSRAVYELGVRFVIALTALEIAIALILGVHLAWTTRKPELFALVALGMFLGIGYSIKPLHFKGRGVWHLLCLWALLYFVPMLYAAKIVADRWAPEVIALAAAYATTEMGIILVNTAEDYPEDLEAGVRTTVVALGLTRSISLAAGMVAVGSVGLIATFAAVFVQRNAGPLAWGMLVFLGMTCSFTGRAIWRLRAQTQASSLSDGILLVKASGKRVPLWATGVGWCGVLCGLLLVGRW
jgi:1,4-dihydroxy-2-naphthoate octaprenyltransferase